MRRFALSDSHGGYKALVQCLERSGFDTEKDQLYFNGDVVDGWPETKESIELLLSIKNLVYLLGNHDQWAIKFYTGKINEDELELWLTQGGAATVNSYGFQNSMPKEHLELLQQAKLYHVTNDNILFVHAGFDTRKPLQETDSHTLLWSREFVTNSYQQYKKGKPVKLDKYQAVYIGHTPTISFDSAHTEPLQMGKVTLLDTGAAFTGPLSIMDIDTREVWQSDKVMTLYPDHEGRNGTSWNNMKSTV